MCHYLGGGLHGKRKRVKAQSESSKSVVNSVLISREMPVFPGFLEIIRVVLLIISIFIYKKFTWQLYKKSIIPVFLYGFLSDFLGVLYLMAISIGSGAEYYEGNDIGKQILSGIYLATNHSCYDSIYGVLFIVSGILFSSICIFAFNYRVSFNNKGLSKKQKIIASLTMAIVTAPYTFLLPKELFYP